MPTVDGRRYLLQPIGGMGSVSATMIRTLEAVLASTSLGIISPSSVTAGSANADPSTITFHGTKPNTFIKTAPW